MKKLYLVLFILASGSASADDVADSAAICDPHVHAHPAIVRDGQIVVRAKPTTYDDGWSECERILQEVEIQKESSEATNPDLKKMRDTYRRLTGK